jgi:ankyrin repeat protein
VGTRTQTENLLDIQNLKYLPNDKINSFTTGYENNNYLILSVINNRFDVFEFLLKEKAINVTFKNSNGWNVIHFIVKYRRFSIFKKLN